MMTHFKFYRVSLALYMCLICQQSVLAEDWLPGYMRQALELAQPEMKELWIPLNESTEETALAIRSIRANKAVQVSMDRQKVGMLRRELLFEARWMGINGNTTAERALAERLNLLTSEKNSRTQMKTVQSSELYSRYLPSYIGLMDKLVLAYQAEEWKQCLKLAQSLLGQARKDKLVSAQAIAYFLSGWSHWQLKQPREMIKEWKQGLQLAHQTGMKQLEYLLQIHIALILDQPILAQNTLTRAKSLSDPYLELELRAVFNLLPSHLEHRQQLDLALLKQAEQLKAQQMIDQTRYRLLTESIPNNDQERPVSKELSKIWAEKLVQRYSQQRHPRRLLTLYIYLSKLEPYDRIDMMLHYLKLAEAAAKELGLNKQQGDLLLQMAGLMAETDPAQANAWLTEARNLYKDLPLREKTSQLERLDILMKHSRQYLDIAQSQKLLHQGKVDEGLELFLQVLSQNDDSFPSNSFEPFLQQAPEASIVFVKKHLDAFRKHRYLLSTILEFLDKVSPSESLPLLKALIPDAQVYSRQSLEIYRQLKQSDWPLMTLRYLENLPVDQELSDETANGSPVDGMLYEQMVSEQSDIFADAHQEVCRSNLEHPHPAVRYFCLQVLKRHKETYLYPIVRKMLKDPKIDIREQAMTLLSTWNDPQLLDLILQQDLSQVELTRSRSYGTFESSVYLALFTHANKTHLPRLETWLASATKEKAPQLLKIISKADPQSDLRLVRMLRRGLHLSQEKAYGLQPVKFEYGEGSYIPLDEIQMALDEQAAMLLTEKPFQANRELWFSLLKHPHSNVSRIAKDMLSKQEEPMAKAHLLDELAQAEDYDAFRIYESLKKTMSSVEYWELTKRFLESSNKSLKDEAWKQAVQYVMNHALDQLPGLLQKLEDNPEQIAIVRDGLRSLDDKPWLNNQTILEQFKAKGLLKDALLPKYSNLDGDYINKMSTYGLNAFSDEELNLIFEINTQHSLQLAYLSPDVLMWFYRKIPQIHDDLKVKFLDILAFHGKRSDDLRAIRELFVHGSPTVAAHALEFLVRVHADFTFEELLPWIKHPDEKIRYLASLALLSADTKKTVSKLWPSSAAPSGSETQLRTWINQIAWKGDEATINELRILLKSKYPKVRKDTLLAIGALIQEKGIPDFLAALEDESPLVREHAAEILGLWLSQTKIQEGIHKAVAKSALSYCQLLALNDSAIRTSLAASYLTRFLSPTVYPNGADLDCTPYQSFHEDGELFLQKWKHEVSQLKLHDIWSDYRVYSYLMFLYQIHSPHFRSEAEAFLRHSNPTARGQALMVLRRLRDPAMMSLFKSMEQDSDLQVRYRAMLAQAALGEKDYLEAFEAMVSSEDHSMRLIGFTGLALMQKLDTFMERLKSMDQEDRKLLLLILAENASEKDRAYEMIEPYFNEFSFVNKMSILHAFGDIRGLNKVKSYIDSYEDLLNYPILAVYNMPANKVMKELLPFVLSFDLDDWAEHQRTAQRMLNYLLYLDVNLSESDWTKIQEGLSPVGKQSFRLFLAERMKIRGEHSQSQKLLKEVLQEKTLHPMLRSQSLYLQGYDVRNRRIEKAFKVRYV